MNMSFITSRETIADSSRRLSRLILDMAWNDDRHIDRSEMDDEIVRMIQLNGMIGTDPELADVF
ncbi:MAG: hypothetical protein KDH17_21390 [Rhodocyclaceae bacterium]|nr:hypothetical protein [Rhodocyclaceae bacterium]